MTASNWAGNSSASIVSSPVRPTRVPDAPGGVSAVASNAQASVSFGTPYNGGATITRYTVTANPGGQSVTGTASPLIITGLSNGTSYTFSVTATNSAGTGAAATSNTLIPLTVPGAPGIVSVTPGNARATVNFSAPASKASLRSSASLRSIK